MSDDKKVPEKTSVSKSKTESKTESKPKTSSKPKIEEKPAPTLKKKAQQANEAKSEPVFNATVPPRMKPPQKAKKNVFFSLFLSLIFILLLASVGWFGYNQYLMQQAWPQLQSSLEKQLNQQKSLSQKNAETIELSTKHTADTQQIIQQQSQLIERLKQSLTATQQKVRKLSGRQQQDWLLAEAEYLIKMAQFKISLEKDKVTSMALLKTADQLILEMADNSLLELRQVIAQDIINLQLIVIPDIGGIASRLNAIAQQVTELDLIALEFVPISEKMRQSNNDSEAITWQNFYQIFLDDFIVIKEHSEVVTPLMTPEQRGNLNANIQLALQQAQIALVRGDNKLYQLHVGNAINWIKDFFGYNDTSQVVLNNLAELHKATISFPSETKLQSAQSIQDVNKQRLYQWLENQPDDIKTSTSSTSEEQ